MMFKKSAQERVPLNLNQLIRNVLKRNQGEAQLGQVSVQAELDEQLPLTTGNPTQLQQVVSNLIANAIDAMSRSEEHTSELQSLMRITYSVICLKKTIATDQFSYNPPDTTTH